MDKEKLTENQKKIIEEMRKNPRITLWELSIIINMNESNIQKNVRKLREKGIIRRIGPHYRSVDRRWEVLK